MFVRICQNFNKMLSKFVLSRKLAHPFYNHANNLGRLLSSSPVNTTPSCCCWILNLTGRNDWGRSSVSEPQSLSFLLGARGVSAINPLQKTQASYHTLTNCYHSRSMPVAIKIKRCESMKPDEEKKGAAPLTSAMKLKKAVAEYGSTVIVFHITISLVSLGVFYLLVDSGLDVAAFLSKCGINNEGINKLASNAGTFAIAYAIHKVFAPVRIGVTLTATPFIVRHFRKIGWLKN